MKRDKKGDFSFRKILKRDECQDYLSFIPGTFYD